MVLAIGSILATASQLILLTPFIHKEKYRHELVLDIKDEHIINMAHMIIPVIIGISVNQINVLVDRTLASTITVGGISALNYADKLNGFVQGLFVAPLTTIMYPVMSKMAAENNIDGLKRFVSIAIRLISFF